MSNRIPFQKPYTSAHDLVCLLQSRGLTVTDTAKAESYLEYIGYYRLSAYMYPLLQMPKEQHRYKPSATFSQVMMLYRFDKKLRLLIFNEIEKIEVAVRSAIVNIGSDMMGNPSKISLFISNRPILMRTLQPGYWQKCFPSELSPIFSATSRSPESRKALLGDLACR